MPDPIDPKNLPDPETPPTPGEAGPSADLRDSWDRPSDQPDPPQEQPPAPAPAPVEPPPAAPPASAELPPQAAPPPPPAPAPAIPADELVKTLRELVETNKQAMAGKVAAPATEPAKPLNPDDLFSVTEEEADQIMAGGKEGAAVLKTMHLRGMNEMAKLVNAALETITKSMSQQMAPMRQVIDRNEVEAAKSRFFEANPDLKVWDKEAQQEAHRLINIEQKQFSDEKAFFAEVAKGVRAIRDEYSKRLGGGAAPAPKPPVPPPAPSGAVRNPDNASSLDPEAEERRLISQA